MVRNLTLKEDYETIQAPTETNDTHRKTVIICSLFSLPLSAEYT